MTTPTLPNRCQTCSLITADLTRTDCCGQALCERCMERHGTCQTKETT